MWTEGSSIAEGVVGDTASRDARTLELMITGHRSRGRPGPLAPSRAAEPHGDALDKATRRFGFKLFTAYYES